MVYMEINESVRSLSFRVKTRITRRCVSRISHWMLLTSGERKRN